MFSRLIGNAGVIDEETVRSDFGILITDDEEIQIGFKVIRDSFIFTDKRLIIVDVQGVTGRKKEFLSIPYDKITMYSIETAGRFDLDAELKLWIGSDTKPLEKQFNKSVNIYELQSVLAANLCRGTKPHPVTG